MSAAPMGSFRLRATMTPMSGQPVNWNARAIIWSGSDRRYYLRRIVWFLYRVTPTSRRPLRLWLFGLVDDRRRGYTPAQVRFRRWLNTEADVLAREAWIVTNRYWKAREQAKRTAAAAPEADQ